MTLGRWILSAGRMALPFLPEPLARNIRGVKRAVLNRRSPEKVFRNIFHNNAWDGTESVSGPGSTLAATATIRTHIPSFLAQVGAASLLDIPCGDAFWIGQCLPSHIRYTGADIVPEIVARNTRQHAATGTFLVRNIVTDALPKADVALVRDCFIHLPNAMILAAIENLRRAGIGYLLTTTFPARASNTDIEIGGFRPVDMQKPPFNFPAPLAICEDMAEGVANNKQLGLWRL